METQRRNIVLIGMPGAGKSTIGVLLAKRLSKGFVDTDVLIQSRCGQKLQQIVDTSGYMALRAIEAETICQLACQNHVIATGGSVVYSDAATRHLARDGMLVFLQVSLDTLRQRVTDFDTRGIARRPDQSFDNLFEERGRLYAHYADITIDCGTKTHDEVLAATIEAVEDADRAG